MSKSRFICCFSGGKDSTAMLIHLLEHDKPIDDILYVNVGDWIWKSAQSHIKQVEDTLGVKITQIDVTDELDKGFQRWGFPSFLNRWCTGVKRDAMRDYLKSKYRERERAFGNTSVTVQMKHKEPIRNYTPVIMSFIHWLKQTLPQNKHWNSVNLMDLILVEYMGIIAILIVGYVLYNENQNYMKCLNDTQITGKC